MQPAGLGPASEASLAVSPSVLAEAALISHHGRCQFVFCLEHGKLNNPSECGFPFSSVFTHKNPFPRIPIVAEPWRHGYCWRRPWCLKGTKGTRIETHGVQRAPRTRDESLH